MVTGTSTTTTNHLPPVPSSDDPYSSFYNGCGLLVRVVTAGELPQNWLRRPGTLIRPGSQYVVTSGRLTPFEIGPDRVVTILKPDEKLTLLWGFKQDVGSDSKGEPNVNLRPGFCKKITDPSMLRDKMVEHDLREGSIFLPYTSGHVNCDGFRLHKNVCPHRRPNFYPEFICNLNPLQMHGGYLLDPKRERSFQRIAETMTSILTMEEANGNGNSDAFQQPVTLYMYDSYRGRLLTPEKLDRATVVKMQENANALSRYESSMGMGNNLYDLLIQSGCERLHSLLKDIPEDVKVLAEAGKTFPTNKLLVAIKRSDASRFHDLLSSMGETQLNRICLPKHLLNRLFQNKLFTSQELERAERAGQFVLQNIDSDRLDHLLTDTFPKQAEICRTLLKHGLFIPVFGKCEEFSSDNPFLVCLLVACGSRAQHSMTFKLKRRGTLTLLYNANKFLNAGLLTEEEVYRIRHEVLLDALCFGDGGTPFACHQIEERFKSLVHKLYKLFLKVPTAANPSALDHNQAEKICHELLGQELWDFYRSDHVHGSELKLFLESRLSPQRYSDDELHRHLDWLNKSAGSTDYCYFGPVYLLGTTHRVGTQAVIRDVGDKGKYFEWLTALLATPPSFDRREFARVGRYRSITQTAGQHYYQYHHPTKAFTVATNSINSVRRRYYRLGLDHALRTQMATELLIENLPSYHEPFQKLLETHPKLPELLKIAEFYQDAVAEDEPKIPGEPCAAELFERDMRAVREYPDEVIALVATALKNKNSNGMSTVQTPFTADDQCSREELLLRQVLRLADVVDMLRLLRPQKDLLEVKDNFVIDPVSALGELDTFDPQAIELLAVVNNPHFTRLIKAALLTFRDLAALTGGWHDETDNPVAVRYQLHINDSWRRRFLIEESPDPYTLMREVLDDLIRLEIAKQAGISACLDRDGHRYYVNNGSTPSCWDKAAGGVGAYRKLHSEVELRQMRVPEEMTLSEKVRFVAESELTDADRPALSLAIKSSIDAEINRLRQEGIQPATGTPSQDELQQMYEKPDSIGASILTARGIVVQQAEHDGRTYFRMVKSNHGAGSSLST